MSEALNKFKATFEIRTEKATLQWIVASHAPDAILPLSPYETIYHAAKHLTQIAIQHGQGDSVLRMVKDLVERAACDTTKGENDAS